MTRLRWNIPLHAVLILSAAGAPLAQTPKATPGGFSAAEAQRLRELEERFQRVLSPDSCRRYLRRLTEDPHVEGTEGSLKIAHYVRDKLRDAGFEVELVEYEAYMPYPKEVRFTLVEPESFQGPTPEEGWVWDKDSFNRDVLLPYNAYSPSGEVTAEVVYVNYGLPEDYQVLEEMAIDVRERLVLARYGRSFRGVKARVAEEKGAAALMIYSDPADDGYMKGDIYPRGPQRPRTAVQRGSIQYLVEYPGDPLTPGWASTKKAKRIPPQEATNLPRIPTMPLSYGDAEVILRNLAGPVVPEGWQGGLPFAYHVGPGPAKVHLKLVMDFKTRPVWNVIGKLTGSQEPEQLVILGNHRDAWTYGAVDPGSGTATFLEVARAFGQLVKTGFRPKRSLLFASWGGEEFGLIGSTEWVEEGRENLVKNAVLYINTDAAVSGTKFAAAGVPSLTAFVQEVTTNVADPIQGKSILTRWKEETIQQGKSKEELARINLDTVTAKLGKLGSGSDFTAFLDHAGVPVLDFSFGGPYGVYHSIYDDFYWMEHFGDPTFQYHATLAKIIGTALLRMSEAPVLPFRYSAYAQEVRGYIGEVEKDYLRKAEGTKIDFSGLRSKAEQWKAAAERFEQLRQSESFFDTATPRSVNEALIAIERDLTDANGLAGRPWFKHLIYAPGYYTGYAAQVLPGIREAIEKKDWVALEREVNRVAGALERVLKRTQGLLDSLSAESSSSP